MGEGGLGGEGVEDCYKMKVHLNPKSDRGGSDVGFMILKIFKIRRTNMQEMNKIVKANRGSRNYC